MHQFTTIAPVQHLGRVRPTLNPEDAPLARDLLGIEWPENVQSVHEWLQALRFHLPRQNKEPFTGITQGTDWWRVTGFICEAIALLLRGEDFPEELA
jgi:hypothetical protein